MQGGALNEIANSRVKLRFGPPRAGYVISAPRSLTGNPLHSLRRVLLKEKRSDAVTGGKIVAYLLCEERGLSYSRPRTETDTLAVAAAGKTSPLVAATSVPMQSAKNDAVTTATGTVFAFCVRMRRL